VTLLLLLTSSCSGDDDAAPPPPATCTNSGGPVAGVEDTHCLNSEGQQITQEIGKCVTGADDQAAGGAGAGGAGDGTDEPFEVRYSNVAQDDDCKYDVSFTNGCIEQNRPVYFTVTLKKRDAADAPATGDTPNSPEIYLESEPSHISPSFGIKAPEGPPGTYKIGPVLFDAAGRWVVRFHFFEECSDVPEDSPHGHVAFYIDVP
jgi:hypothetical protein